MYLHSFDSVNDVSRVGIDKIYVSRLRGSGVAISRVGEKKNRIVFKRFRQLSCLFTSRNRPSIVMSN